MHKLNQKGFTGFEITLLVLVVALIGFAGYTVYEKNKPEITSSSTAPTKKTNQEDTSLQQPVDLYASWKEFKNSEYRISFKYPNESGWESFEIKATADGPLAEDYKNGQRINNAGVDYRLCGKNCGLAFSYMVNLVGSSADPGSSMGEKRMADNVAYKLSSKTSVEQGGLKGTRWLYKADGAGDIIYYYFSNTKYAYSFDLNSNGSITSAINITDYGQKIFSTVKFL